MMNTQENLEKCLSKTINLYQSRLDTAKQITGLEGIAADDVIALETVVGELKKLSGGTAEDLKRKIAEWITLHREYDEIGDNKGRFDATWVLIALETLNAL
jgi:hypothetical protein